MASNSKNAASRPSPLRTSRSFTRPDPPSPSPDTTRPKRASTLQSSNAAKQGDKGGAPDTFESRISEEITEPPRVSVDLEGLPIELVSLTDSFIDQLTAKVHPTPPNIESLSSRFQDFYATAASHIQTHVDSLASRRRRDGSPTPTNSSRASAASLLRAKAASLSSKDKAKAAAPTLARQGSDQQMLTADEYADRRKARKAMEQERLLLEEAVERRLCEGIYDKIYRHHTTQDEAQDGKLRSKTAALAVVGIGPVDLGVELVGEEEEAKDPEAVVKKQEEVKKWLEGARKELILMNQSRYPLGKLNHLKAAHKSIIDTLSHFHPSSSADELMPMLIYTLITLPPENINVISDVNFIHRFRWEPKLTGETAYCLTNLEATISFLETVDLSTLRADEAPTGPTKGSSAPGELKRQDTFPPAFSTGLSAAATTTTTTTSATGKSTSSTTESTSMLSGSLKPGPSPAGFRASTIQQLRNRRLSDLVNTPAQAFNAASDSLINTADQGLKTIGNSLGDSYKFLLGKLREHPEALLSTITNNGERVLVVPKTLEDARKLIATPPPGSGANDDDATPTGAGAPLGSAASSMTGPDEAEAGPGSLLRRGTGGSAATTGSSTSLEDKMLNLIGGRKVSRDHSADSARSSSASVSGAGNTTPSAKRGLFSGLDSSGENKSAASSSSTAATAGTSPSNPALIDSVRNLSNSFNPMRGLSGLSSGLRGFGRTPAPAPPPPVPKDAPATVDLATVCFWSSARQSSQRM